MARQKKKRKASAKPLGYAKRLSPYDNKGDCGGDEMEDDPDQFNAKIDLLVDWIKGSKCVVAHTGAGISTSAGIPDFRGANGIWTKEEKGEALPDHEPCWNNAVPTPTHMALRALWDAGLLAGVITQNIDGLHGRSGIPAHALAELHGNMFAETCQKCGCRYIRSFDVGGVGFKPTGRFCTAKIQPGSLGFESDTQKAAELNRQKKAHHFPAVEDVLLDATAVVDKPEVGLEAGVEFRGPIENSLVDSTCVDLERDGNADLIINPRVQEAPSLLNHSEGPPQPWAPTKRTETQASRKEELPQSQESGKSLETEPSKKGALPQPEGPGKELPKKGALLQPQGSVERRLAEQPLERGPPPPPEGPDGSTEVAEGGAPPPSPQGSGGRPLAEPLERGPPPPPDDGRGASTEAKAAAPPSEEGAAAAGPEGESGGEGEGQGQGEGGKAVCGGALADQLLDWEDELPEEDLGRALGLVERSARAQGGLALALGTSLQMDPSRHFPGRARRMAIVNLQRTGQDRRAALALRARCDAALRRALRGLGLRFPIYTREVAFQIHSTLTTMTKLKKVGPSARQVYMEQEINMGEGKNATKQLLFEHVLNLTVSANDGLPCGFISHVTAVLPRNFGEAPITARTQPFSIRRRSLDHFFLKTTNTRGSACCLPTTVQQKDCSADDTRITDDEESSSINTNTISTDIDDTAAPVNTDDVVYSLESTGHGSHSISPPKSLRKSTRAKTMPSLGRTAKHIIPSDHSTQVLSSSAINSLGLLDDENGKMPIHVYIFWEKVPCPEQGEVDFHVENPHKIELFMRHDGGPQQPLELSETRTYCSELTKNINLRLFSVDYNKIPAEN